MRKLIVSFLLAMALFFILNLNQALAAILVIRKGGELTWNVLSSESDLKLEIPERSSLKVRNLAGDVKPSPSAVVSLENFGDKVQLKVVSEEGVQEMDVSRLSEDIIEIEEIGAPKKLKILVSNDQFLIKQDDVLATTSFSIQINTKDRMLSVQTPSGLRYVSIFPFDAVENTLKANIINRLEPNEKIELLENEKGELVYDVVGSKVIELFNLFKITVPVEANISALTGQVLAVKQPIWFKMFGFLIT